MLQVLKIWRYEKDEEENIKMIQKTPLTLVSKRRDFEGRNGKW